MANTEHVDIVKQGAETIYQWREKHPDERLDLGGADLHGANLQMADLHEAIMFKINLEGTDLRGADLSGADLREADLRGAFMEDVNLSRVMLYRANLSGANLRDTNMSGARLHRVQGAYQADHLEDVRFTPRESSNEALYFENCQRHWCERWLDWERLRIVGRLPLFGVSYSALILIPIIFYGLALYNDHVALVRAWAEQVMAQPDHLLPRLALLVLERLHPRQIPRQSFLLLVSTILLAAGSTLYTFFCPSRIKEFSRDQWCDQLGRSLLHYWPLAWKHRIIRLVCAACYALGGAGALWVLGTKVWRVLLFILK